MESRRRAASGLIESHDAVFRRTARRYSICADDAEDAYQRALEILLTKAPPIEGDALVRWMQTVTKREALAVRRQRERLLGSPRPPGNDDADRDPLEFIASESPGPNDQLARRERVTRSGEALRALKPQEVRALTLKAQGYSYAEIGEITGWSYTKINRCMAEGRKRFLQVFADIEQGRRCEELAASLSELADGEGGNGSTEAVEFHLRSCASCRAKLRAYRALPGRVFDLLPAGPLLDHSAGGGPHEWLADRAAAAVDKIRETGYSLMARGGGGDGEATALATAGGARGAGVAAVAKVLAICGATAAGGATCVATGLVDPGAVGAGSTPSSHKPAIQRPAKPFVPPVVSSRPAEPQPTAQQATPAAQESPPPAQAPTPVQQKARQFSFESGAASSSSSGSSSGGSSEFGGPSSGGGSSGGGGGSSGGGGFGIEG
jgi:RNA polymerase sigma factor (sigma-70 family)